MRSWPHDGIHFTLAISLKRFLAQVVVIQFDEPLLGGAENHRIVAAPAMRVAVRDLSFADQHAFAAHQFDDQWIRFEYGFAFVFRQAFHEAAFVVLRRVSFEIIFLAGAEVVDAVARSGVHDAAALIERHVIGEHSRNGIVQERVAKLHAFEFAGPSSRLRCR